MLADLTPPLPLLLLEVVVNKGCEAHWGAAVAPALPYIRNIRDMMLFLTPGSGSGIHDKFFRIPDLGSLEAY